MATPGPARLMETDMHMYLAKTLLTGAALAAGLLTTAQANAGVRDLAPGTAPAHTSQRDAFTDGARMGQRDAFTDGARMGQRDAFTDGARMGQRDAFTDGARSGQAGGTPLATLGRQGFSACASRPFDPYQDGMRSGPRDPYSDGGRSGPRDAFSDGARTGQADPYASGTECLSALQPMGTA